MVKDFIQYTEALELKQLGFDEKCFCNWEESWSPEPEHEIRMVLTTDQTWLRPGWVRAPTFSQAFRWFRDNGKVVEIFSQLLPSNKYKWGFKIQGVEGITDGFFTYEEAELACLKKLIEIVKTYGGGEQ